MITTKHHYSLLPHNTFGIAAECATFIDYDNIEDLSHIAEYLMEKQTCFLHIGEGSNLLFTKDYPGVILHSSIKGIEIEANTDTDECLVTVGAGEKWDDLVAKTIEAGLYGLENLSHIPGEVGAAAVQNIGAYGVEVADHIESVCVFEWKTKKNLQFSVDECDYGYRKSRFKTTDANRFVITHVTFKLYKKFKPCLSYSGLLKHLENNHISVSSLTPQKLREIIIHIRQQKLPETNEIGSAGSFFMNPIITQQQYEQLTLQYPQMPHYLVEDGVKVPAAWLIEQCGWKGKRLGDAGVYEHQALVLVNYGNASGEEIVSLSQKITNDVLQKFDIKILPEVNFI